MKAHARLRARHDEKFDDRGDDADVERHVGQDERELLRDADARHGARRGLPAIGHGRRAREVRCRGGRIWRLLIG